RFELRDVPAGLAGFLAHGNVHQLARELRCDVRESPANSVTLYAEPVPPFIRLRAGNRRFQFLPGEKATVRISGYSRGGRLAVEVRRLSLAEVKARKEDTAFGGDFRVPRG